MRAGPGEAQQRGGELLRRDDAQVRRQAVEEPDRDDVLLGRGDVGDLGKITVGLRELRGGARGRHDLDAPDHLAEPAQASPERHALGEPGTGQRRHQGPAAGRGRRVAKEARRSANHADPAEQMRRALFSEAPDACQPALPARALESLQRVDAESVVENFDLSRAQTRNAQTLGETARERRPELVVQRKPAGPDECLDVAEDRRADARDLPQPSGADRVLEVSREGQQGLRGSFVGPDLETVRAGELQHLGDFRQHASDLPPLHRRSMTQDPRPESPLG